jgi:transposase
MDNARFHHSEIVLLKLIELGSVYKFLPPYSPQLNPKEKFLVREHFLSVLKIFKASLKMVRISRR